MKITIGSLFAALVPSICLSTQAAAVTFVTAGQVAFTQVADNKTKVKELHFARVKGDGTLVNGTALSATRFSEGTYMIKFDPPIGNCAAAANSAAFQGFDGSVFRVVAQISIGFGGGGAFDDETVRVSLFSAIDGSSVDSSFSLVLMCP